MDQNPFTAPGPELSAQFGSPTPVDKDDSMMGVFCHLLSLAGFVVPLGNILGPLVIWLIKRQTSPYVDAVGKEALNFNISWSIYMLVASLSLLLFIGILLLPIIAITWLIFVIMGSVAASNGKFHRYPLTIRFIK